MKYFPADISLEEAKRIYRRLAKTMHPDVGGDAEDFVVLASEYGEILAKQTAVTIPSYDDIIATLRLKIRAVVSFLNEVYPRTSISIEYSPLEVEVYINTNTPLPKMLHIEELIRSFELNTRTVLYFRRGGSVRWYSLEYVGDSTYHCNIQQGEATDCSGMTPCYEGRRYFISQNKKYALGVDAKTNTRIIMKRTPKFNLQELMGL